MVQVYGANITSYIYFRMINNITNNQFNLNYQSDLLEWLEIILRNIQLKTSGLTKSQGLSMNDVDNNLNMKAVSLVHFVPKSISISM